MARWVKTTKRVKVSHIKGHWVSPDAPTYSAGQTIAVVEHIFCYWVHDGNHRLRDERRAGKKYIVVDVWRKR